MIKVNKYIQPDFTVKLQVKHSWRDELEHRLVSISFSEGIMVSEKCNEEGDLIDTYGHDTKYYAIRLNGDTIETCDDRHGYMPIKPEIQEKYNEILAEKEILGNGN